MGSMPIVNTKTDAMDSKGFLAEKIREYEELRKQIKAYIGKEGLQAICKLGTCQLNGRVRFNRLEAVCPYVETDQCRITSLIEAHRKENLMYFYQESGIGRRYWYPDQEQISHIKHIKNLDQWMQSDFLKTGKGLFILGPVGVSKTSCLSWIAGQLWIKQGLKASYYYAPQLFDELHGRFAEETVTNFTEGKLILIDDLFRQYNSEFGLSRFETVFETRYGNKRPMVITANVTPAKLAVMLHNQWSRIIDRLQDITAFQTLTFTGQSKREKSKIR